MHFRQTRSAVLVAATSISVLAAQAVPAPVAAQVQADVQADAGSTLKVGPGQTYVSLQGALDAIPASVTSNFHVQVYPGTYTGSATLQGKSLSGGSITLEKAQSQAPVFTGAVLVTGGWAPAAQPDVWSIGSGNTRAVTDGSERLAHAQSLAELARTSNAWFGDAGGTYVKLVDLASPNTRQIALTTSDVGLRSVGVPVTVKGLQFVHYAVNGIWMQGSAGSNLTSVAVQDVGNRGPDDAGVLLSGSPNTVVVNAVVSDVHGAGVRINSSSNSQVLNGSFYRDTTGVSVVSSTGGLIENNAFGLGFEAALVTDAASEGGLNTSHNVYGNVTGLTGKRNGSEYVNPQAGAGGETGSQLADPKFRSTSSAYPSEETWLLKTMHDQDAANNGGNGWATDTDASHLAWDWGFLGQGYLDMYRATGDTRWLAKVVSQSDQIWAQAYDNPSSPGVSPDGLLGWSTSRYSVALISPSTVSSAGGDLRVIDSAGAVVVAPNAIRIYGPGNGDNIPTKTLELRFVASPDLKFEIWDVTGAAARVDTCSPACDYDDGTPPGGNVTDPNVNALANGYSITWQVATAVPAAGDKYRLTLKAKKQLEYENIDARVTAPMADFALTVINDPSIQQLGVAGSTFLAKAQAYLSKIDANVYAKWLPYFKDLSTTPGANGSPGGIYVYPSDAQYSLPSNTNPLNMQADMGRLWANMFEATGDAKYAALAQKLAQFIQSKLQVKTRNGQEYYYWLYYNQAGSWDTWTQTIPEDINHGGLVAQFAQTARQAGLAFTNTDLVRFRNTFMVDVWDPANARIYYYLDRTSPLAYGGTVYWLHHWGDLPGGEPIAQLAYSTYQANPYSTTTGVVYETLAESALKLARVNGAHNFRVRSGSPTIRAGVTTPYDKDFDGRSRAALGAFDVGAFSFVALNRLAGADRYDTAVKIDKDRFPNTGSASGAVLTRGDVFADGLAGAPFAAAKHAAILLTKPKSLPAGVLSEVKRVVPAGGTVWILGGPTAVSSGVSDALTQAGFTVERVAGADRYETTAAIAAKLPSVTEVFIANGTSFPDPLAASAAAVSRGAAILLAKKSSLPAAVSGFMTTNTGLSAHLVGGTAVLDMKLSAAVQALASTDRYAGDNRYSTTTALANGFFGSADSVGFATGTNFPDSLVAGAHIGGSSVNGPLLLVKSTSVPKEVSDYLKTNGSRLMGGFVYGGTSAVSKSTQNTLESSL